MALHVHLTKDGGVFIKHNRDEKRGRDAGSQEGDVRQRLAEIRRLEAKITEARALFNETPYGVAKQKAAVAMREARARIRLLERANEQARSMVGGGP